MQAHSTAVAVVTDVTLWRTAEIWAYVGGLSNPSKMPSFGYSIPATRCKVGSRLRKVKGSTCASCYALKGRYVFRNVTDALERRYETLDAPLWVEAMAELIRRKATAVGYFRWHDAGDLQSAEHLARIVAVAELTPDVRHWLPTREYRLVREYIAAGGTFPENLTVRLSAHMIGGHVPTFRDLREHGVTVSTVDSVAPDATPCAAPNQDGKCLDCRACWDRGTDHVTYRKH
jgi:hypothetical protein